MSTTPTKRSLSPERRRLVELMQKINFGRIEGLRVFDGEPVLDPPPRVFREIRFGGENAPHAAHDRNDFSLKKEHIELFAQLDRERSVTVEQLVVNNGLPVRMTVAGGARVG
jgi:hypothetical protein